MLLISITFLTIRCTANISEILYAKTIPKRFSSYFDYGTSFETAFYSKMNKSESSASYNNNKPFPYILISFFLLNNFISF